MTPESKPAKSKSEAPDPTTGTRRWDMRWDAEQRRLAVFYAKDSLRQKLEALEIATRAVGEAADWIVSVTYFRAHADAREAGVDV